jgi:hypothetical protein
LITDRIKHLLLIYPRSQIWIRFQELSLLLKKICERNLRLLLRLERRPAFAFYVKCGGITNPSVLKTVPVRFRSPAPIISKVSGLPPETFFHCAGLTVGTRLLLIPFPTPGIHRACYKNICSNQYNSECLHFAFPKSVLCEQYRISWKKYYRHREGIGEGISEQDNGIDQV